MKWQSTSGFIMTKIELFIADELTDTSSYIPPGVRSSNEGMFNIVPATHLLFKSDLYQTIEAPNMFFWDYIHDNRDKFWIHTSRLVDDEYIYKDGTEFSYLNEGKDYQDYEYPTLFTKEQVIHYFRHHVRFYYDIIIPYIRLCATKTSGIDGGYVNLLGENTPVLYDPLLFITGARSRRTINIKPPLYTDDDGVVTLNGSVVTPVEIEVFDREWEEISNCCGDYLDI